METIKCKKYKTADGNKNYWDWYKENNTIVKQRKSKVIYLRTINVFADLLIKFINDSKHLSNKVYFDIRISTLLDYYGSDIVKNIKEQYGVELTDYYNLDVLRFNFLQVLLNNIAENIEIKFNDSLLRCVVYMNYYGNYTIYNTHIILFYDTHPCNIVHFLTISDKQLLISSEPFYCLETKKRFSIRKHKNFRGHIYGEITDDAQIVYCSPDTKNYLYDYCKKKYEEFKSMNKTEMLIFERMLNAFI